MSSEGPEGVKWEWRLAGFGRVLKGYFFEGPEGVKCEWGLAGFGNGKERQKSKMEKDSSTTNWDFKKKMAGKWCPLLLSEPSHLQQSVIAMAKNLKS